MKTIIIKNITIIIIIFIQIISAHEREMMMQVVDNNGNPIVLTVELYELDNLFEPYRSGRSESYWKWVSPSSANVAADHGGDLIPDPTFPLVEPGNYRLRIDNKYTLLTINTEYNGDGDYIIKFQNNQFSIVMNNRGVSISETNDWDIPITVKNFVNSSETGRIQVNGVDIQTNTEIYLKTTTSHDFYAPDVYTGSDFRNWNNIIQNNIYQRLTHNNTLSDDMAYEIISSHHEPTHPLTVHNYLEGGSGGIINIAWLPNGSQVKDDDISSGEFYNAFDATDLPDRYNVSINQTILGQYGTNWEFQYWDDGSTSLTRSNIAVSEPTTLKAYYKGVDKTDAANALTNNNQSKIIRIGTSSTRTLFKVYESMDCVWLEKSTNNGVSWELMNDGKPHQHFL
ncbi:MAG: hypothetical protein K8F36_14300 [Melioribacteraceae bacterium]|nr:hypothetical protein [Melioribacteraceae bacterium]